MGLRGYRVHNAPSLGGQIAADELVIALAGNPNTGKSTVFNRLTGLKQHTGNWPGKTVAVAQGRYEHQGQQYVLVDLPGTYSLLANSAEEEVARDFICSGQAKAIVVVTDATCLERNLNLALQIMEITRQVIVCVNLLDEAKRKQIGVDLGKLATILGVPVVGTSARDGKGLDELKTAIHHMAMGKEKANPLQVSYAPPIEAAVGMLAPVLTAENKAPFSPRWQALRLLESEESSVQQGEAGPDNKLRSALTQAHLALQEQGLIGDKLHDSIVSSLVHTAERIARSVVTIGRKDYDLRDRKIDRIVTSRSWGFPIMLALLGLVFWLTIKGANYPSQLLFSIFWRIEEGLSEFMQSYAWPDFLHGFLVLGIYRTLTWVVAVMLPPMAIFFPLFTLLEDLGYLPRIAFNLDSYFKRACAHGKQALSMCMGFGCNAAGVVACRIIDSPRERLIAILTNSFVPCNGRFPLLIALVSIFFVSGTNDSGLVQTLFLVGLIVLSVLITLVVSRILSRTILKGLPSSFALELPPYRKPQVGRILIRSLLDRTLFVLGRAVVVAAPAGAVIWLLANSLVGDVSLLQHLASWLQPFARLIGLDGYILLAFILALPANEIVIPIILMSYTQTGALFELDSVLELRQLLVQNGWTWLTALCTILFSLNHWPCGTTLLTIQKETQSSRWATLSFLLPTVTGVVLCFLVTQMSRILGFI